MFFEQYSHEPTIATPRFWITHRVEMTEERKILLQGKRRLGYDALGVMERHLEEHDFFVAGRYSIADVALYAYTHVTHEVGVASGSKSSVATPTSESGFDLSGFPAVRAWIERVRTQPGHIPVTQG